MDQTDREGEDWFSDTESIDIIEMNSINESIFKSKYVLNSEELVPEMIDNTITGEELLQHFQEFFEIFKREELPESHQILEAKDKLSDNIVIRKLRDLHLSQLRAFIQTKPFITRNDLRERNEVIKREAIEEFKTLMKSNNTKLVDKLYDILKTNFEIVFEENEEKSRQHIEEKRDLCGQEFMDALNKELQNNGFVESETLEELFKTLEKKAFDSFNQCFCGEVKNLFERELFDLTKFINCLEEVTRDQNNHRIREFEKSKEEKVIQFYNKNMRNILDSNTYLSEEDFIEFEKLIRNKTDNKFRKEYDSANPSTNEMFFFKVNQKLNESKSCFRDKNQIKCEIVSKDTQKLVSDSIDYYSEEMEDWLFLINSVEDLKKSHKIVLKKVNEDMKSRLPFKAPNFIADSIESFKSETNKLLNGFKRQIQEKNKSLHNKYLTALDVAKWHYFKKMNDSLEAKDFLSNEELNSINKQFRVSALKVYESYFEDNQSSDHLLKSYKLDLKESIDKEFHRFIVKNVDNKLIVDQSLKQLKEIIQQKYSSKMNSVIDSVWSQTDLNTEHNELMAELLTEFRNRSQLKDKTVLEDYQEDLRWFMVDQLFVLQKKFNEKLEDIIKSYKSLSKLLYSLIQNVTPLSLGVNVNGTEMRVMIPRNSPVPTTITKRFSTVKDFQTNMVFKIFEGEKKMVKDNQLLGQLALSGIPIGLLREQTVDLTFTVNDEGILHVIAQIVSTGVIKDIKITKHKGRLTKKMIKQLLAKENPTFGNGFK